jgi:SAM-dependent methyltransferase
MARNVKDRKEAGENHAESYVSRYHDPRFWHRRYHRKRSKMVMSVMRQFLNRDCCFLDAGAGTGEYLIACQGRVGRAVGADISLSDLRSARQLCASGADVVRADICRLPFAASSFDLVLCTEVLEHVEGFDGALAELFRVGRGTFVITMPCASGPRGLFGGFAKRFMGIDLKKGEEDVGHINMWSFSGVVQKCQSPGWSAKARTSYIFCEPMATYPIPSLFSPFVSVLETLLDRLFPRAGNHVVLVCQKRQVEPPTPISSGRQ